jgi:hypothetical protein
MRELERRLGILEAQVVAGFVAIALPLLAALLIVGALYVYLKREFAREFAVRADALQQRVAPKLEFKTEGEHVFWLDPTPDGTGTYLYLCVGIHNGSGAVLKNVHVELDRMVVGPNVQRLRRRLRLKNREQYVFDLAPHKTEYVLITRHLLGNESARLEFMVEDKRPSDCLPLGDYKVKLKAYSEEGAPTNRFFPIWAHESGRRFRIRGTQGHS